MAAPRVSPPRATSLSAWNDAPFATSVPDGGAASMIVAGCPHAATSHTRCCDILQLTIAKRELQPLCQLAQAERQLAAHEADDAVDLAARQAELAGEHLARLRDDREARTGDPARGGRAVDLVERGELIDRELVEVVLAQHVALALGQRGERARERGLDL